MQSIGRARALWFGSLCAVALAAPAHAQSFVAGDLYLVSGGLPKEGGGTTSGAVRVDPSTWATQTFTLADAISMRPTYCPVRERLVIPVLNGAIRMMDAAGAVTTLPSVGAGSQRLVAATGDGRIYVHTIGSDLFQYYDAFDGVHDVLDPGGASTHVNDLTSAMFYHAGTNSLFTADSTVLGEVTIKRHQLSIDGSQVVSVTSGTVDISIATEVGVGMNHGPGGSLFLKIDDNSGSGLARMQLIDPETLVITPFATSNYAGVGGEVAGAYSARIGKAVVLDSLNDVLRVYALGESGAGMIVPATGVSWGGGSGEIATFIEISNTCPADLNGDGSVDGADLAALLAAWGGTGPADFNNDMTVDGADLAALLAAWGPCA